MFHTPSINRTVHDSAQFIKKAIRSNDLDRLGSNDLVHINYEVEDSQEDLNHHERNFELLFYLDNHQKQTIETIKNASKFQAFFQNKLDSHIKIVKNYDNKSNKINPFYSPSLCLIIMK